MKKTLVVLLALAMTLIVGSAGARLAQSEDAPKKPARILMVTPTTITSPIGT